MLPLVTKIYVHDGANENEASNFEKLRANKCSILLKKAYRFSFPLIVIASIEIVFTLNEFCRLRRKFVYSLLATEFEI